MPTEAPTPTETQPAPSQTTEATEPPATTQETQEPANTTAATEAPANLETQPNVLSDSDSTTPLADAA